MKSNIQPFKLCENIYFVGSRKVSVHIIKTDCGLIMLDTGYPEMYEQILDSMAELGLNPKDICAIFHSHGHIDHFGCTHQFKEISGAKTYISRIDNDIVNGTLDLSWAAELGYERLPFFDCDVLIDDGDVFTFGDVTIRCVLSPGHTDGTLSFFIKVKDGDGYITAAMHGGIGLNSMTDDFLNKYNLSFDCRDKFREGLHRLAEEQVDIVLGNHPAQSETEQKLEKVLRGESVIDRTFWARFLDQAEKNLDEKLKEWAN